jgi:P pilus assembly chaperone PapD
MRTFFRYLVILLLSSAITSSANASFGIMPMEVQQKMAAGETRLTDEIEVYNGSDQPLHITGSVKDWKLTPGGEYEYSEAGTDPLSCAKWIQLSPATFNVLPKKSVRVRYTITAPQTVFEERHAMIFFLSRPLPSKTSDGMGVMIATRMGCKVFVSPAQAATRASRIADMDFQDAALPRVKVLVQNTASAMFRAKGTLQVRGEDGTVVAQASSNSAQVLPGATRELWFEFSAQLQPGNYVLKAVIDYGARQLIGGELKAKVTAPGNNFNAGSTQNAASAQSASSTAPTRNSLTAGK